MSTVFYGFRAKDEGDLEKQVTLMKDLCEDFKAHAQCEGIEIQVFSTSEGLIYRVLELGYGLKNKMWKKTRTFRGCNYDTRSDMPRRWYKNKKVIDEIDELIRAKKSKIIVIVPKGE